MYFFDLEYARKFITKKKGKNNFSKNCPTFNLGLKLFITIFFINDLFAYSVQTLTISFVNAHTVVFCIARLLTPFMNFVGIGRIPKKYG